MNVKKMFHKYSAFLSEDAIVELAKEYGVEDKRKRKLTVVPFFWLMVLSAIESAPRGCLSKLVAFFTASFSSIHPGDQVTGLSSMALSKKLSNTNWMFFRGVYNRLLTSYINSLEPDERLFFAQFKDCFSVDGSIIRLNKILEKLFKSTCKSQAALKLNAKFSNVSLAITKLQVTDGKRHDSRFRFITKDPNILYLFDLGYWSFVRFKQIADACSFFVSRLKKSCDPLIVTVSDPKWAHLVGKRLSQIMNALKEMKELDVRVQLAKSKQSKFKTELRLVGVLHEGEWRFYVTNIFDALFTPSVIYELYSNRWTIEIFFNDIKHILKLSHIFSKTKNGIMVEIYSALICYLLIRIMIAIAAKKSRGKITDFSFKKSVETFKAFFLTQLTELIRGTKTNLMAFFQNVVSAIVYNCQKPPPSAT
ncbi:IS4 transposase [Methanophagales archaeon]|nr:IS4 transposase [Methanophagales archaeon]